MLSRLEQIAIAIEAQENTAVSDASLYVAGNMAYSVINPEANFDLQVTEREIKRDTLTNLRPLLGRKFGSVRFGLELAGATGSGAPEVDIPLRACGFRRSVVVRLTIGAVTGGPFRHGETVSQATSGATGMVVGDTYTGQTFLFVAQDNGLGTGTFDGTNGLTGGSSAATATPSAVDTTGGFAWWPYSFVTTLIGLGTGTSNNIAHGNVLQGATSGAIALAEGASTSGATTLYVRRQKGHFSAGEQVNNVTQGNIAIAASSTIAESQLHIPSLSMGGLFDGVRESISGARGTVSMSANVGEPWRLQFEFKGAKKSFQDAGLVNGISYTQKLPDVWLDGDTQVSLDGNVNYAAEVSLCIAQAQFDMANDVQFRLCADDPTGQHETYIAGRKPTFQIDPEFMPEAHFPWNANFTNNVNFRQRHRLGTAFTASDKFFLIQAPGNAITSMTPGDRNGLKTRQVSGALTSGAQSASTLNRENELVIIYNSGS